MTFALRCLLLLCSLSSLWAYAAFDDPVPPEAPWMTPPIGMAPEGSSVIYRIVNEGDRATWIEIENRGVKDVQLTWTLPWHAQPGAVCALNAAPGKRFRERIAVARLDHGLKSSPVIIPGSAWPAEPLPKLTAYQVTGDGDDSAFAAHLVATTAMLNERGEFDLHVRYLGNRPLHLDWRVVGLPDYETPRLHLLPGRTVEVRLPADERIRTFPGGIGNAIIAISEVRVGDDGPELLLPRGGGWRYPEAEPTWSMVASGNDRDVAFDPRSVLWKPIHVRGKLTGLELHNRGNRDVVLDWRLIEKERSGNAVAVAAGAKVQVAVEPVPWVAGSAHALTVVTSAVGGQPPPPVWSVVELTVPPGAVPVVPVVVDRRFNPLQLLGTIKTSSRSGEAVVTLYNAFAIDVKAEVQIEGYQTKPVAVTIAAGGSLSVKVPVSRQDPALEAARLRVAQVWIGGLQGQAWCGSFAP